MSQIPNTAYKARERRAARLTKRQAIQPFGSMAETARALGVSFSCVGNWPDRGYIPERWSLVIRHIAPEHFAQDEAA